MAFIPIWVKKDGEPYKRPPRNPKTATLGVQDTYTGNIIPYYDLKPTKTNFNLLKKVGKDLEKRAEFERSVESKAKFKSYAIKSSEIDFEIIPVSPRTKKPYKRPPKKGTVVNYEIIDRASGEVKTLDIPKGQKFDPMTVKYLSDQINSPSETTVLYQDRKGQIRKPTGRVKLTGNQYSKKDGKKLRQVTKNLVKLSPYEIVNNRMLHEVSIKKGSKFIFKIKNQARSRSIHQALKNFEFVPTQRVPKGQSVTINWNGTFQDDNEEIKIAGNIAPVSMFQLKRSFAKSILESLASYGYKFTKTVDLKKWLNENDLEERYDLRTLGISSKANKLPNEYGMVKRTNLIDLKDYLSITGTINFH